MKGSKRICRAGLPAVLAVIAGSLLPAAATAQAPNFQGKTITILYGGGNGGGYDTYARLIQPHLGRHIPGDPRVIVESAPGAGTLVAAEHIYSVSRPDGTEIGTVGGGTATAQLLETPNIHFDPRKFVWLGSVTSDVSVGLAWYATPFKTIEDTFKQQMIVGGGGPTSGNVVFPVLMNRLLGTKFKIIPGYKSSAEAMLAVERGELQGVMSWNYSSIRASHLDLIRDHKIRLLIQFALKKHKDLPDVPLITELAKSDSDRAILRLIFSRQEMGRPFMAPPGTPPAIAKVLRQGFAAMLKDPAFLADAERQHLDVNQPMTGEEVDQLIAELYATPPDVVARAIKLTDMSNFR